MQRALVKTLIVSCYITSLFCLHLGVQWIDKPFPGFLVLDCPTIGPFSMYDWTGPRAGLKSHVDHIITMDGEYVYSSTDIYKKAEAVPEGTNILYGVIRTGKTPITRHVNVATMRFRMEEFTYCFGSGFIFGIIVISLGTVAYISSKERAAGLSFLAMCLVIGMYATTGFEIQSSAYLMPVSLLCSSFMPASVLLFALHWPTTKKVVQTNKWINGAMLLPSGALFLLMLWAEMSLSGKNFALDEATTAAESLISFLVGLNSVYLSICGIFLIISIAAQYFRSKDIVVRSQARIALLAIVWLLVAAFGMVLIAVWGVNLPQNYLPFVALIFPASITYSILRYGMFSISILSRRNLSEVRYRSLVEQSLTGICIVQDEIIRFTNQRLSQISGYTVEELTGMPVLNLICPEDKERVRDVIKLLASGEDPTGHAEFGGLTKCGETRWMETLGRAILFEGRPAMFVNIIDATERKMAEEQLRETNRQLVKLESLKDDLTNMIVHDMKNPVTNLMMGLDLIQLDYDHTLTKQQREYVELAKRNLLKLSEMISNLLEISKIESDALEIRISKINLSDLVSHIIDRYSLTIKAEENTIDVRIDPCAEWVLSDERLLERILSNILSNAIKHSCPKGEIIVRISPAERHEGLLISIQDFGDGIPEEYHQKIFEKFGQADVRELGNKTGTGLGLAFCKMAVEALGGNISVESKPGKGSCFTLLMPEALPSEKR